MSLPSPVLKLGRFAATGALSLLLLSQFAPLGLLTPVEAYTAPTGWTYKGVTLNSSASTASAGDTVVYSLVAHYQDTSGNDYYPNVTNEATFTASYPPYTSQSGAFTLAADGQSVNYVVGADAKGKTLMVKGTFNSFRSATVSLQVNP